MLVVEHYNMHDFILYIAFTCTSAICVVKLFSMSDADDL
jgi:hypothetical protein